MPLINPKIITDKAELKSLITRARDKEEIIVFTNGCFDIIHPGHVFILEQAKAKGDILIVHFGRYLVDGAIQGIFN